MTAFSAPDRAKQAKVLPLLASDKPGEVVAGDRVLGRHEV